MINSGESLNRAGEGRDLFSCAAPHPDRGRFQKLAA
jgi:hypothetical protein